MNVNVANPPEAECPMTEPHVDPDLDQSLALEEGVADALPVIPIVCRLLTDSAAHVERSVVGVCEDFQTISDKSRESVSRASRCLDLSSQEGQGVRSLTDSARMTISRLLGQTQEAHSRLMDTAGKVEAFEQQVRQIEEIVRKVDRVSASIKILSLNARIEAARAGAAGKAFAVVASETGKVATDAAEMNQSIQDVTQRLSREVHAIASEIRDQVAVGRSEVEAAREEVGATLGQLADASDGLRQAVEAAAKDAEDVARMIGRAVMALQFQDNVSQRVAHAVAILQDVQAELADTIHPENASREIGAEWESRIKSRFTMAEEHNVLQGEGGDSAASNIELF